MKIATRRHKIPLPHNATWGNTQYHDHKLSVLSEVGLENISISVVRGVYIQHMLPWCLSPLGWSEINLKTIFIEDYLFTSTTFNRFKSSIVILFKFNAKVLTILGRTVIKAFFLCFYNEFAVESSLYVLFAWHYSVSVISNQTAFHHSWGLSKRYEFTSIWN